MKKSLGLLLTVWLLMPFNLFGQSYESLWKQVGEAESQDLPQTQMERLDKIISKADKEKNYGQLIKARLQYSKVMIEVSPDSLQPSVNHLKQQALDAEQKDPALAAVLNSILGKVYQDNPRLSDDWKTISQDFFDKSLSNPNMLASHVTSEFNPLVEKGVDSEVFNNDLLHLLGFEAERYGFLRDYYVQKGNRRAALLCALEDVKKRYEGKEGTRFRTSMYVGALDSLIAQYFDLPECGEVAIARSNFMSDCSDVTVDDHVAYIHAALKRWSSWKRIAVLKDTDASLRQPSFTLHFPHQIELPDRPVTVTISSIRNVSKLQIKITRLNHTGESEVRADDKDSKLRMISGTEKTFSKQFTYLQEYEIKKDSMAVGPFSPGVYLVEVSAPQNNIPRERHILYVSNLMRLEELLPEKKKRYVVVNATTGQPVPNAKIKLSFRQGYKKEDKVLNLSCDRNGEVVYQPRDNNDMPYKVFVTSGNDCFLPDDRVGFDNFYYHEDVQERTFVQLYTDREIYRPGQTVHMALIAHNRKELDTKAVADKEYVVKLRDANHQIVEEKTVRTDAYGTASADFVLPTNGLTGHFQLQVDSRSSKYFRVEEYKRPTFQVEFDEIKVNYKAGDVIMVTGRAKTYAGVPVQDAKVSYTVMRTRAWWWRWGDDDDNEELSDGEITTDANGEFKIDVPLELPEWVDEEDHKEGNSYRYPRFYSFNVNASVTDQGGESHGAETRVPLGSKPTAFSCEIEKKSEKKDLKEFRFSLRNAAGQEIPGTVSYTIDGKAPRTVNANEKVSINALDLSSGRHVIEATCGTDTLKEDFVVFTLKDKVPCIETHDWFYQTSTTFPRDGGPVTIQVGSSDKDTHIIYTIISGNNLLESGTLNASNSIITRNFTYKESYGSGIHLSYAWVKDGEVYTHAVTIQQPLPEKSLKVKWVTFRDLLTPGQKEEWTLQVSHPDGTPAQAQFMATMYDKSLNQLAANHWQFNTGLIQSLPWTSWQYLNSYSWRISKSQNLKYSGIKPLHFSSYADEVTRFAEEFSYYGVRRRMVLGSAPTRALMKNSAMAAGMAADEMAVQEAEVMHAKESLNDDALNEVVVVGYGTQKKSAMTGSIKEADEPQTEVQVRENLNETAFFYPTLVTDEQGQLAIRFTLPESVTTWQFMGLAHDKEMNYGMLNGTSVAKKDVMVQPNMPRFIRIGDKATITTKIFNTAEKDITGQTAILLIDPETEQTVMESTKPFSVGKGQTTSASFDFEPTEQTPALLICKVIAYGDGYSDGEQHYLPILPNSEWVTNTAPFTQHEPGVKTVDLKKLIPADARNTKITVEYTNNPAWLMVQTLPFIGDVNEHNAISLAAAYYANKLGAHLIGQAPEVKNVFKQWQMEQGSETSLMSALEKNQDLKALVLNETPWVMDAKDESNQKKALANFFDENTLNNNISSALTSLKKLQKGDGSFSWWEGMIGSPSMTAEVMEFLTRLNLMIGKDAQTTQILESANSFLSEVVIDEVNDMKRREKKGEKVYIWYSHALQWVYINAIANRKLSAKEQEATDYLLGKLEAMNTKQSMYAKAKMAVVLAKNGKKEKANLYMKSLKEYMVYTEEAGRYFDTPRAGYSWCDYRIPAQTAAIEALQLLTPDDKQTIAEMQRWLLMQKRTQNWDTPINCVNAVYAFLNNNTSLLVHQEQSVLKIDGKPLELPKATAGIGYVKTVAPVESATRLEAEKTSSGTSWGAVYAQFFQPTKSVKDVASGMVVTRQLLTTDNKPLTTLKVGDRIKVRLTIQADRDYDYVQLIDKRAACMEPVQQLSGYHWGYYCAPKDNVTNYYFDILSKGKHVIETEYYIDRPGVYETGTCIVQCAYSPEYMGRTKSQTLVIQ